MSWPYVTENAHTRPRPLKYVTGAEIAKSCVIYSSVVTLDSDSRRLVTGGSLLCKITSGDGADKWGPYSGTATDGRQTIAADAVAILGTGVDVTLGDHAVEGYYAQAVFDKSELTGTGYNFHSAPLTALAAAMPSCVFDD